jgi:class 3 adenylate cyclase/Tfp pilus assembly protein PilF
VVCKKQNKNMKNFGRIILIVLMPLVQANANTDSLRTIWNNQSVADTVRIDAMNELAWEVLYSKPDSAFICAQKAYDLAHKLNRKGDMAVSLNTQGASYWARGSYSKALSYFKRSHELFYELGDLSNSASCLNNMGIIYRNLGNNLKGLKYLIESLKIREQLQDSSSMPGILSNIGLIYQDQKNYKQAMAYYKRSLAIREQQGDSASMAGSLTNMGLIFQIEKNYSEALTYFEKSLAINRQIEDRKGEANALNNIGLLYKEQGDIEKALAYLQESKAISLSIGDNNGMASSLMSIGMIEIARQDHTLAIKDCKEALKTAEELGDAFMQKESCSCLFQAYKAKGDAVNALLYHELLSHLEDSIQTLEISDNLLKMEFERQVAQDSIVKAEEARIIQKAHEEEMNREEKTRNVIAVAGFLFLVLAGAFFSRWRYVKISKDKLNEEKIRSENLLLNILPEEIAQELKLNGKAEARDFDVVSILFTDFKSFTETSAKLSASDLVAEINICFECFDGIIEKYDIEKIKTIGDAYMAAGGLPVPTDDSVKNTVLAALEMQAFIEERKKTQDLKGKPAFEMRVGIHTGPVVAGIVGVKKFQYDIWGDTVNTASRMESSGEVGKVNISQATYELLKDDPDFAFESRGKIEAKGKGEMEMYFVTKRD